MKKMTTRVWMAAALLVGAVTLSSCSSDDDGGSASSTAVVIDKKSGLRVKQVGSYRYTYDEKGRVERINHGYDHIEFDYDAGTVYIGADDGTVKVSFTSKGYIAKVSGELDDADASFSFSYDSSGHLTKISTSGSGTDEGVKYSTTGSWTFNWSGGLLKSIKLIGKSKKSVGDKSVTEKITETTTFEYNSGNENKFLQYAPSLMSDIDNGWMEAFAFCGLLGVGPQRLPESSTWVSDDDDDEESNDYYYYTFNSDGSIKSQDRDNFYYDYVYDKADYARQSVTRSGQTSGEMSESAFRKFFGLHQRANSRQ